MFFSSLAPPTSSSALFPYTTLFRSTYPLLLILFLLGMLLMMRFLILPHMEELFARFDTTTEIILRSEEHTSELQSRGHLVCRLLLEKKKNFVSVPHDHKPLQKRAIQ